MTLGMISSTSAVTSDIVVLIFMLSGFFMTYQSEKSGRSDKNKMQFLRIIRI